MENTHGKDMNEWSKRKTTSLERSILALPERRMAMEANQKSTNHTRITTIIIEHRLKMVLVRN